MLAQFVVKELVSTFCVERKIKQLPCICEISGSQGGEYEG
jgi:hypothetical protein